MQIKVGWVGEKLLKSTKQSLELEWLKNTEHASHAQHTVTGITCTTCTTHYLLHTVNSKLMFDKYINIYNALNILVLSKSFSCEFEKN